ncbi:hypothetical protein [Sulfuricaulis sp.]|jgi:hypothetical protein|uniref:hypothetical protein n=1 Tax=Sulfuricaulis sp. TaxID=2003553 RepID=UPI0035599532
MIQFLADNIDQLDLALDQLAVTDRNFDRFALMLIDNVVELTLHRFAQDQASENDSWGRLGEPKHDPKQIQKALGQNFDNKVKFAASSRLITDSICESILYLHSFRNTAYHKGQRHEGILHSLAIFYFQNACELLKSYDPKWWSWGSSDRISHRARKYIGDPQKTVDHRKIFNRAYVRLGEISGSMDEDLINDLSTDMADTIDSIDEAIRFLADDSPKKESRDNVIIDCQAWSFAFTDEAKEFSATHGWREKQVGPYVEWIAKNFNWPLKSDPIPGWRSRLESLKKETSYHKALKKYCDFMRQTEDIRGKLVEAATQLNAHIQMQIDAAREK